jgi:hypothetical protein
VSVKSGGAEVKAKNLFGIAKERAAVKIESVGISEKSVCDSIKKAEQSKVFAEEITIWNTLQEMAA